MYIEQNINIINKFLPYRKLNLKESEYDVETRSILHLAFNHRIVLTL